MEVGGSDSGVEPTPDSSLTSEREIGDGTSEGGSESSGASGRRPPRTPRTPLSRSVSARTPTSSKTTSLIDGRWPSNTRRGGIMSASMGSTPDKTISDKCFTLPRRRRRSAENLTKSREPSLNRTASLRRKKVEEAAAAAAAAGKIGLAKKTRSRTKIYHETGSQTGLTGADIEAGLGGRLGDQAKRPQLVSVSVQAEGRLDAVDKLEKDVKEMEERVTRLNDEKSELKLELDRINGEKERQEKRIRALIGDDYEGDLAECVEKDRKKLHDIVKKQQVEINQQHTFCCNLKRELERCALIERKLLEEQKESEAESLEIQEFLQAEKSTLAETLKEMESELSEAKKVLSATQAELAKQQEECTHLVRMCEQRRQEKLSLESRLRTLELRSKETMLEQGAAVSGAAVALSGLGSRLEILVSSLVSSYSISPADLEDVIYHNEVFSESPESSGDLSPEEEEKSVPESRGGRLLAVILNAIKSATHRATPDLFLDSELLTAEPEPPSTLRGKRSSLISLPELSPSKSKRASVATSDDFDLSGGSGLGNSESLQNLSDAILRRQREEEESVLAVKTYNDSSEGGGIVDQVIEVDNLVTRLLRVLHIIEASRENKMDINDARNTNDVIESLRSEVELLKNKLNCSEKCAMQFETVELELKQKEKELSEMEKKFELTQELLTNNWHKAMYEVRRLYDAIDSALEMMQSCETEVEGSMILARVRRNLEESNFRCSTSLPVSSSRPDLNANAPPSALNVA